MKYKIRKDLTMNYNGTTLYRIELLKKVMGIEAGTVTGWIESEDNLSQDGDCLVYAEARVFDKASVSGNAIISGHAQAFDNAKLTDNAAMYDTAVLYGNANLSGFSQLWGNSRVDS